jgi:penicillin amidase
LGVLRKYPLSTRFAAFVALPLVAFSIWSWYELRQALPPTGSLRLNGISAPVEIARDLHGVPTVNAAKERDAFFAVGLLHAQDRLWQLEILRRTASGRLSEVLGSGSLPWDLWARSLDLYGSAQQSLAALSEGAAASLSSYADGVNEGIRTARGLPPEFLALGLQPEPWSVVDSLAVVKMFEFRLSGNFRSELRNSAARNMLADDLLKVLLPNLAGSEMFDERRDRAPLDLSIFGLAAFVEGYTAPSSRYAGSNAWAVAAPQGQSGGALLANDPHLALQIPSPWYVVAIDTPQLSVSGMGLVGTPLVFMGRNRSITWGITNLGADTQDLYYELVDSRDPTKYDLLDSWVAFETRTEEISIREDFPKILNRSFKPVTRVFRKSTNGPIINDLASFSPSPLALQWTGFSADDASYEAFYRLSYARDWAEFRSAVSLLVAPSLNFFYADQAGNIGYQAAGRIPIRNMGTGVLPVQRGRSDAFWTGYIPFDAMPRDYNPETGYVINSNNLVSSSTGEYFLSHEWAESGRHDRIKMLLDGLRADPHRAIDVKSMMAIQLDTVDLVARRMLPLLSTVTPTDEQSARALAYIKEWDGDMSKSSVAASIFHTWMMELRRGLFEDDLKQAVGSDQLPALLQQLMDDFGLSALADVL